ncbi:MAG: DUF4012 domain-containing protein, partial [Actinobacteria bacterium]|nr:DUF4012 domain-containing protein [Actinomycetota bacterium]
RLSTGRQPTKPGLDHLSHRLYRIGFGRRKIAMLHGLTAMIGTGAVLASSITGPNALIALPVLYGFFALAIVVADHRKLAVRSRRGRIIKYALLAVLALGLLAAPTVARAAWEMRGAQQEFAQAIAATKSFQLDTAQQHFLRGGRLAEQAKARLEMWITLPARYIPIAGDNLRAAEALAEGATLAAPAATTAVQAAQKLGGPEVLQGGFSAGQIPIDPLVEAASGFESAATQAELALSAVEASGGFILPPLSGAKADFITEMQDAIDSLHNAGDAATLMPYVFGAGEPRTWLLIIQNPVELRATGGFIGAFGILNASDGQLSLERFDDNREFPQVPGPVDAPEDFAENYDRYASRSNFRNANMTPDFPTAAGVLSKMWRSGTGRTIDGVIAVDAVGLNYLLGLVGPVTSAEMGEINSDNFLKLALNEAYIRFPAKEQRSSVLLEVGREVWSRLLGGNFPEARQMIEPLGEMVTTKRLQMWSPGQQERIERLGLSGELQHNEGDDYLLLVGQNAGANKIDYYAERTLSYRVDLRDPQNPAGELTVQIQTNAPDSGLPRYIIGPYSPEVPAGLNRTITSIYLPEFAGVTEATVNGEPSSIETFEEKGLSVASKVLDILAGETATMSLSTRPPVDDPGIYRLKVQQQPTLNPDRFKLDVVLPEGVLVHGTSGGMQQQGNVLTWSGDLERAHEFEVRYGPWL